MKSIEENPILTVQQPNQVQYLHHGFPWITPDGRKIETTCLRSETVYKKYPRLFDERKRCVSITKGYFEYSPKAKRMMFFKDNSQEFTYIAGLWDNSPLFGNGAYLDRYVTLTCEPNGVAGETQERMPVLLSTEGVMKWLDPRTPLQEVLGLLVAYPDQYLKAEFAWRSKYRTFEKPKAQAQLF